MSRSPHGTGFAIQNSESNMFNSEDLLMKSLRPSLPLFTFASLLLEFSIAKRYAIDESRGKDIAKFVSNLPETPLKGTNDVTNCPLDVNLGKEKL